MASIGKLALSLASGVQETTLAFANFSFDFAIIKMEAPLEYHGLGNRLSKKRKLEAEEGHLHVTARQLGALFAEIVPPVPNLARIYGLRVSEISENPIINPAGSASDGPLASHIGIDGTTIWAAATSGRGALQVHLLACILVRAWPGAEAVSIWSELVAARKLVLQELLKDDQFHMGHVMAARIEIGLENLAEWDASARAWLGAA
ncbi:hypothetical protein DL95DRAFT_162651 [Leptodontidium sp. 2 PMI_412]|nr:hypothetical protein DL95DRAFT_162651 [Leptodontidium sp. 2 PMI_412]